MEENKNVILKISSVFKKIAVVLDTFGTTGYINNNIKLSFRYSKIIIPIRKKKYLLEWGIVEQDTWICLPTIVVCKSEINHYKYICLAWLKSQINFKKYHA